MPPRKTAASAAPGDEPAPRRSGRLAGVTAVPAAIGEAAQETVKKVKKAAAGKKRVADVDEDAERAGGSKKVSRLRSPV